MIVETAAKINAMKFFTIIFSTPVARSVFKCFRDEQVRLEEVARENGNEELACFLEEKHKMYQPDESDSDDEVDWRALSKVAADYQRRNAESIKAGVAVDATSSESSQGYYGDLATSSSDSSDLQSSIENHREEAAEEPETLTNSNSEYEVVKFYFDEQTVEPDSRQQEKEPKLDDLIGEGNNLQNQTSSNRQIDLKHADKEEEESKSYELIRAIQESGEMSFSSGVSYIAVVAIDFGTTFSGFAFAFNHKEGEKGIYMNKGWGSDQGWSTLKTPTCLLLNPNESFHSFGFEAQDKFAELKEAEALEYYYFEKFKMILHKNENLSRETTLEASNGRHVKASEVFSLSIQYLKDRALEVIQERTGNEQFCCSDVQWVLTVPAIWTQGAKQFMREAAYKAGLGSPSNPEQVLIALEPEAAAVYCRGKKMRELADESGNNDALLIDTMAGPETQYIMIVIGGGTLDVTVHQIQENGAIKEIHKASGGPYGGMKVNEQFRALLELLFTRKFMYDYIRQNPADWLHLMNDFELKKRGKRVFDGRATRVRLPRSFVSQFPSAEGGDINASIQQSYSLDKIKVLRNEYLCLEPEVMRELFEPVLSGIVMHLSSLLEKEDLAGIKYFFLVGGFSDSTLLQERIKSKFGAKYRVLVPQYASIAVVQGAVMFEQTPDVIESRIMTSTYGTRLHRLFLDGLHPESKKEVIGGIARCKDVYFKFVKANEVVKVGDKRRFTGFAPLTGSQKKVNIDFYLSESADPEYVTDAGVHKAPGGLVLETPEAWKTNDIEIILYFGGTEIKVTAVNLTRNTNSTAYLDFLSTKR